MKTYFRYKQFNKDVITVAVGYYLRYALSYRDISEILKGTWCKRSSLNGSTVGFKNMPQFYIKFGRKSIKANYKWRIDETYIKIKENGAIYIVPLMQRDIH